MLQVEGEHRKIMVERNRTEDDVEVRDDLTAASKERADFCEALHDRVVESQEHEWAQKLAENGEMGLMAR